MGERVEIKFFSFPLLTAPTVLCTCWKDSRVCFSPDSGSKASQMLLRQAREFYSVAQLNKTKSIAIRGLHERPCQIDKVLYTHSIYCNLLPFILLFSAFYSEGAASYILCGTLQGWLEASWTRHSSHRHAAGISLVMRRGAFTVCPELQCALLIQGQP